MKYDCFVLVSDSILFWYSHRMGNSGKYGQYTVIVCESLTKGNPGKCCHKTVMVCERP